MSLSVERKSKKVEIFYKSNPLRRTYTFGDLKFRLNITGALQTSSSNESCNTISLTFYPFILFPGLLTYLRNRETFNN